MTSAHRLPSQLLEVRHAMSPLQVSPLVDARFGGDVNDGRVAVAAHTGSPRVAAG
jgi:hypothetical protein